MPKAILEYNLPDDQEEFYRAVKSRDMACMLWEILLNYKKKAIRQLEADNNATDREFDLIDKIFSDIWELAKEHDVNIENLIS